MFCIERALPDAGIFAAVVTDGEDITFLAAAFNVPAITIRRIVIAVAADLLKQVGAPQARVALVTNVRRARDVIAYVERRKQCEYTDLFNVRELVEVLEVRAYLRAFRNAPHVQRATQEHQNGTL